MALGRSSKLTVVSKSNTSSEWRRTICAAGLAMSYALLNLRYDSLRVSLFIVHWLHTLILSRFYVFSDSSTSSWIPRKTAGKVAHSTCFNHSLCQSGAHCADYCFDPRRYCSPTWGAMATTCSVQRVCGHLPWGLGIAVCGFDPVEPIPDSDQIALEDILEDTEEHPNTNKDGLCEIKAEKNAHSVELIWTIPFISSFQVYPFLFSKVSLVDPRGWYDQHLQWDARCPQCLCKAYLTTTGWISLSNIRGGQLWVPCISNRSTQRHLHQWLFCSSVLEIPLFKCWAMCSAVNPQPPPHLLSCWRQCLVAQCLVDVLLGKVNMDTPYSLAIPSWPLGRLHCQV